MAYQKMRVLHVLYDPDTGQMVFALTMDNNVDLPPMPPGIDPDLWWYQPGVVTTTPMVVRRSAGSLTAGVYLDPTTLKRYIVTWNGTTWSEPKEVIGENSRADDWTPPANDGKMGKTKET